MLYQLLPVMLFQLVAWMKTISVIVAHINAGKGIIIEAIISFFKQQNSTLSLSPFPSTISRLK
jgi:hypothetical protein